MALTKSARRIPERVTAVYAAQLVDENAANIALAALTTLTLTLYDVASLTTLNSREGQNVLNANNVVVSATGGLTWTMQPADNAIVDTDLAAGEYERHVALWTWTYASGTKTGRYETTIEVQQLDKVTA